MDTFNKQTELEVISFQPTQEKDLPTLSQAPKGLTTNEAKLWLAFQHGYGRHKEVEIFVSPSGQLQDQEQTSSPTSNLSSFLQAQLNDSELGNRSWLLLADAGMGKTTLSKQLTQQLWQYYAQEKAQGKSARMPLYIHLPQIPKEQLNSNLLDTALKEQIGFIALLQSESLELSQQELSVIKKHPLVIILDGYDEISVRENIYQSNQWHDPLKHYDIKVVYTCRLEALVNENKQDLFAVSHNESRQQSKKSLMIYQLQPFTQAQIEAYLKEYVTQNKSTLEQPWQDWTTYQSWMNKLPGLTEMIQTPMLLNVITRILPTMVAKAQKQITKESVEIQVAHFTKWYIYETFVEYWIKLQTDRIDRGKHREPGGVLYGLRGDLGGYLYSYLSNLASYLWKSNNGRLRTELLSDDETLQASFLEPRRVKSVNASPKEQKDEKEKYEQLLKNYNDMVSVIYSDKPFFLGEIVYKKSVWVKVTSEEHKTQLRTQRIAVIRSGGLMKVIKGQYQFLHKTLIEYLTMERMTFNLHNELQQYLQHAGSLKVDDAISQSLAQFNHQPIRDEPNMVALLVQQFKDNKDFIRLLSKLIMASATNKELAIASGNAATILNKINPYIFEEADLSEVQIPMADLSNSWCWNTDFRGGNVAHVWFNQANLNCANFAGANITEVVWGNRLPMVHPDRVFDVAHYQPAEEQKIRNGGYWLVACENGYAYQWQVSTQKLTRRYNHGHKVIGSNSSVLSVAVHNKSNQLATGGADNNIILWDLVSGKKLKELCGHTDLVNTIAWHPNGEMLASGSKDCTIRLWNKSKCESLFVMSGHKCAVSDVSWNPDGNFLASTGYEEIRLWNADAELVREFKYSSNLIRNYISWHPDGKLLAASCFDGVYILNIESGLSKIPSDQTRIQLLSWHPKGESLAFCDENGRVGLLDAQGELLGVIGGHTSYISQLCWHPDGELLASGSVDKTVQVWNTQNGAQRTHNEYTKDVRSISWHPNGELLASGGHYIQLWNLSGESQGMFRGYTGWVRAISWHPQGKFLVSGGYGADIDENIQLWTVQGEAQRVFNVLESVSDVAWHPRGDLLAIATVATKDYDSNKIRLFNANGQLLGEVKGHNRNVASVCWHPDGELLASGSWDSTVRLWSVQFECQAILNGHTDRIESISWHPHGELLASGSLDKTIRLWSIQSGARGVLKGHTDGILSVLWHPHGELLASGSQDKTIRLWDLHSESCLQVITLTHSVTSLAFHPKWDWLAASTFHGIYLYKNRPLKKQAINEKECQKVNYQLYWCRERYPTVQLAHTNFNRAIEPNEVTRSFLAHKTKTILSSTNNYQPYSDLFIPIPNTAHVGLQKSLVAVPGCELSLSEQVWVVTVARQTQQNSLGIGQGFFSSLKSKFTDNTQHVFLILEGIIHYRRFIIRADLYALPNSKEVTIRLKSFMDESDDNKYNISTFIAQAKTYEAQQWQVDEEMGKQLIANIREDQRRNIFYNLGGDGGSIDYRKENLDANDSKEKHNCVSWCRKQLQLIDIDIQPSYHTFGVTMPGDLTKRIPNQQPNAKPVQPTDPPRSPRMEQNNNNLDSESDSDNQEDDSTEDSPNLSQEKSQQSNPKNLPSFFPRRKIQSASDSKEDKTVSTLKHIRCLVDERRIINQYKWAVHLVKSKGKEHVFLIIEGKVKGQDGQDAFVLFRTDYLLKDDLQKSFAKIPFAKGKYIKKILEAPNVLRGQGFLKLEEMTLAAVVSMQRDLENSEYQGWDLSLEQAETLLEAILSESQKNYSYNIGGDNSSFSVSTSNLNTHNCVSWCEAVLKKININIAKEAKFWHPVKIPSSRLALAKQLAKNKQATSENASENKFEREDFFK